MLLKGGAHYVAFYGQGRALGISFQQVHQILSAILRVQNLFHVGVHRKAMVGHFLENTQMK
jgi:hypothetical protein